MKSRLPQGYNKGDMQEMLKRAQQAQVEMREKQAEIEARSFSATSGGGAVSVTVSGKKLVQSIELKPEIVDPDDVEMLQDLITAAVNEAMRAVDAATEKELGALSTGLGF